MNIKDKTIQVLMNLGASMSLKGFKYVVTAMELFKNGYCDKKLTSLYWKIGQIHNSDERCVERCIRHFFKKLLKNNDISLAGKYLDLSNNTNGSHLSKLYYMISKELEE